MHRIYLPICAVLFALAALPQQADAQVKNRWRLNWHNEKPEIYTHRSPNGKLENYWYFTYDIVNTTDQIVPVILDVMMYTETGKDLQHSVRKVDRDKVREMTDDPSKSEILLYGRFYSNVIIPQGIEYKIIEKDAKLSNRSQGIVYESIENFKKGDKDGNRWYLNPREMRKQRWIKPKQKLHGIAIFRDVDPRARRVEIHVSGLIDIIRIEQVEEFETKMHYENNVLRVRYNFKGDEYDYEKDWLVSDPTVNRWMKKRIGPVASKETLQKLVDALLAAYKREKKWKDEGKDGEELTKLRKEHFLSQLDIAIQARIFRLATGKDFGFDSAKSVMDNEKAIWRIHEWWVTYQSRLVFNTIWNRFEVKSDKLPGEVDRDK